MFKLLLIGITVAASNVIAAQTALFTTRQDVLFKESYRLTVPEGLDYPWISPAVDYDNNGSADIILYGHHSMDAYIWRNAAGAAEYLPKGTWTFGVRDPIWMDVDNDGDLDGIGTEGTGIRGELFVNDGAGNYSKSNKSFWVPTREIAAINKVITMPPHIPAARHPLDAKLTKVHFVDLNNDGVDELIPNITGRIKFTSEPNSPTRHSGYSWVYEQQNGQWVDVTEKLGLRFGVEQNFIAEDLDVDGDLDLIDLFNENIYRNDNYTFTRVNTSPIFGGARPYDGDGEIEIVDLDNNGYRDFVFGRDHNTAAGVYLNTGAMSFQALTGSVIPTNRRWRKFADFDNDGDMDMVAFSGRNEMIVYDNVTPNPGMHITFASEEYFGTRIRVVDSQGKLVFNTQLYQYQNSAMSQVYSNRLHIGGVKGEVQVIVNSRPAKQSAALEGSHMPDFRNNALHIPSVEIDGVLYVVDMQFDEPAAMNRFTLKNYQPISTIDTSQADSYSGPRYKDGVLTIPRVRTASDDIYKALLKVASLAPMTFTLFSAEPL